MTDPDELKLRIEDSMKGSIRSLHLGEEPVTVKEVLWLARSLRNGSSREELDIDEQAIRVAGEMIYLIAKVNLVSNSAVLMSLLAFGRYEASENPEILGYFGTPSR